MSELSSSLAHELNQPVAIILTNAQAAQRLLAQEPPDLTETRDILADIVSETSGRVRSFAGCAPFSSRARPNGCHSPLMKSSRTCSALNRSPISSAPPNVWNWGRNNQQSVISNQSLVTDFSSLLPPAVCH